MKLILASGSKNRQDLFNMVGLKYEVVKSTIEEKSDAMTPEQYVMDLSKDKASCVASMINEQAIIVAADTVIWMHGTLYEKPKSKEQAYLVMKSMSGKTTYGITGVTIKDLYKDKEISYVDIKWYVDNDKDILNRCGYNIHGKAAFFVDKIEGDYNTVVGISLSSLQSKLKELGYNLADFEFES